jgi:hypothetical protein
VVGCNPTAPGETTQPQGGGDRERDPAVRLPHTYRMRASTERWKGRGNERQEWNTPCPCPPSQDCRSRALQVFSLSGAESVAALLRPSI